MEMNSDMNMSHVFKYLCGQMLFDILTVNALHGDNIVHYYNEN